MQAWSPRRLVSQVCLKKQSDSGDTGKQAPPVEDPVLVRSTEEALVDVEARETLCLSFWLRSNARDSESDLLHALKSLTSLDASFSIGVVVRHAKVPASLALETQALQLTGQSSRALPKLWTMLTITHPGTTFP